jgi:hypothetical protein
MSNETSRSINRAGRQPDSNLDSIKSYKTATTDYSKERFGAAASQEYDKWSKTTEAKADVARRAKILAQNAGGAAPASYDAFLNRAGREQKSSFEESYIRAKSRQLGQAQSSGGSSSNQSNAKGASNSISSTTSAPTQFANTSTPNQEQEPIANKAVTFANSPSNVNVSTPSRSFTISNFRSEIESGSVLPSHSYLVTFSPFRTGPETAVLNQMISAYRDPLTLRCENVVLPTIQLVEEENLRRYGYGTVEKVPYGVQFGDLTLTWIIDRYSQLPDFFHQWMNSIVSYESKGGLMREGVNTRPGLSSRGAFEMGYKDDYACPVLTVNVYNQQLVAVADYIMYDVFPLNIQSINLSWTDENQYQKLTVTFAFIDMETRAPVKGYQELIDAFETGKINPNEEKQQITNKGRDAVRDNVQSESDPRLSVLATSPFSGITTPTPPTPPAKPIPPGPGAEVKNTLGQPSQIA